MRMDPFYTDFHNTFGTYPSKEEHEVWRSLVAPLAMYSKLDLPKEYVNNAIAHCFGVTAMGMGMPYAELFMLIDGLAREYYQASLNHRIPMQFIYLGNLIPDKYGEDKYIIAALTLTYLERMVGFSRFDPPAHSTN